MFLKLFTTAGDDSVCSTKNFLLQFLIFFCRPVHSFVYNYYDLSFVLREQSGIMVYILWESYIEKNKPHLSQPSWIAGLTELLYMSTEQYCCRRESSLGPVAPAVTAMQSLNYIEKLKSEWEREREHIIKGCLKPFGHNEPSILRVISVGARNSLKYVLKAIWGYSVMFHLWLTVWKILRLFLEASNYMQV